MKVKEAMNRDVISINFNIRPIEAFEKMYREGIRRIFVVDDDGNPIGVLSYSDLIGVFGTLRPTLKRYSPKNWGYNV